MKNHPLKWISLSLIISLGFVVLNCSKDNIKATQPENHEIQNESKLFLQKVKHFIQLVDQQKNGVMLKSGDKIAVDSALFYIGATFNYQYCFTNSSYSHLDKYTFDLTFPVDENEEALVDVVIDAYNDAVDSVRVKYRSISETTKKPVTFLVENTGIDASDNQGVKIVAMIGTGNRIASLLDQNGYFGPNEWYHYTDQSYNCFNNNAPYGAPDILDMELINIYQEVPPPGKRYIYWNEVETDFPYSAYRTPGDELNNHCDYLIFYASSYVGDITDETECLKYDQLGNGIHEMDHYFDGMQSIIDDWLGSNNGKHFVACKTNSYNYPGPPEKIGHTFAVIIGDRIVEYPIDNNYPIPID